MTINDYPVFSHPSAVADILTRDDALLRLARAVIATGYRFTTTTPETHRRVNAREGNEKAKNLADVFGWSRPFPTDLLPASLFSLMQQAAIAVPASEGWRSTIRISTLVNSHFIHSAYPTDGADSIFFGPDTYRFAAAIAEELQSFPHTIDRAIDIGCGAGPGGILVAQAHPSAEVLLADINDEALRLAAINAKLAGLDNVRAIQSDILTDVAGSFDLIISNPPYLVDRKARAYRHGGGDLGADLSLRIVDQAVRRLTPGGSLILYTGVAILNGEDPFKGQALKTTEAAGLSARYREIDPDLFGEELDVAPYDKADRIAAISLVATRPGE